MTLALARLTACSDLTVNPDRVIALEISGGAPTVEEGDTLRLTARTLNAAGEAVPNVTVTWAVLDTGTIGFTLNPSGLVTATAPGAWRVQASADDLRSGALTITVTPLPDSAAAAITRVVVPFGDAQSMPLTVTVYDLTTTPGTPTPLAGKPVTFEVVQPTGASPGFFLTVSDTTPGPSPLRVSTLTGLGGASVVARRIPGQATPDSALVDATATTARGAIVPGTPIRFVVVFSAS